MTLSSHGCAVVWLCHTKIDVTVYVRAMVGTVSSAPQANYLATQTFIVLSLPPVYVALVLTICLHFSVILIRDNKCFQGQLDISFCLVSSPVVASPHLA